MANMKNWPHAGNIIPLWAAIGIHVLLNIVKKYANSLGYYYYIVIIITIDIVVVSSISRLLRTQKSTSNR